MVVFLGKCEVLQFQLDNQDGVGLEVDACCVMKVYSCADNFLTTLIVVVVMCGPL